MKALRRIPGLLLASSVALALAAPAATAQAQTEPARLSDVTVSSQPDAVTVFVKTSREPRYNAELIDGPVRLVVDLADTVYSFRKTPPRRAPPAPAPGAGAGGPARAGRAGPGRPGDAAGRAAGRPTHDLVRLQGRRRREPAPHPRGRERSQHRHR